MAGTASPARVRRTRTATAAVLGALGRASAVVRRIRADRVVPVAAVLTAVVLLLVEIPLAATRYEVPVAFAFLLAIAHTGALPMALSRPRVAATVSLLAVLALQALSVSSARIWPWWPALMVTQALVLAVVAARAGWRPALLQWVLALGASAILAALLRPAGGAEASVDVVVFGGVAAVAIAAALLVVQWRRIRSELLHERRLAADEAERRVVMEERTRIARELHDVVAHSLSIITVQSSTARYRHRGFSEETSAEFDAIGERSRQALDEMRGLLRVLRGSDDGADRRPQPGLADVAELVEQARAAGTAIRLDQPDGAWDGGVGALTGLAAYRIVQEATSNAIRHAPGAPVHVRLGRTAHAVEVAVTNPPSRAIAPAAAQPGHGLVGMAERAASVGGSVRVGRTDDGGYAVTASLPVTERPHA